MTRPLVGDEVEQRRAEAHSTSRTIVTGPSLTSSTSIRAPKTPVSTWTPSARSSAQKRSYSGSACSGGAAP